MHQHESGSEDMEGEVEVWGLTKQQLFSSSSEQGLKFIWQAEEHCFYTTINVSLSPRINILADAPFRRGQDL